MAASGILCRNYREFISTMAARRRALGWSQLECDARAGFQDQYTGKLEIGTRGVGRMSLETWLDALGVDLLLVPRDSKPSTADPRVGSAASADRVAHHHSENTL
jgi:hypothetical protein